MELIGKQNKIWTIWNHKNKIIFRQEKVDAEAIFCMA